MFEKFGEFDSVEELNQKAAELKAEGKEEELKDLAVENGLEEEDAEDYLDECTQELATDLQAALGKLRMEERDLQIAGVLKDWKTEIVDLCTENREMRRAVRKKDKSLCECMARMVKFAFENKEQVSEKIVKACRVKHNGKEEPMRSPLYLGAPNRAEVRLIARDYYLGGAK